MKEVIKGFLPSVALAFLRRIRGKSVFSGNYASRVEALQHSTGYDSDLILNKVTNSMLQVKQGHAKYERDSVLFDEIQHPFPLLAGLLRAAVEGGGHLNVLDFGGSLGSSYFQTRDFLAGVSNLQWSIVEQENFIRQGRQHFQSDVLHFYFSIEQCLQEHRPNVVLLSSVLQYLDDPYRWLDLIMDVDAEYIIIDRTPLSGLSGDRLCVQKVPPEIYPASYPCWILSERKICSHMQTFYDLNLIFDSADGAGIVDDLPFAFKGMIWKRARSV